jgi:ketosteroid isomerase-like protein
MSQENVEIVRRCWEAWIKGDLDALFALFDPAVEWDTTNFEGWPEDGVYHGQAGVRRFMEDWLASWDAMKLESRSTSTAVATAWSCSAGSRASDRAATRLSTWTLLRFAG